MTIALGIDTGGTYTDAVLISLQDGGDGVLASAKALTTRRDLSIGIDQAVRAVLEQRGAAADVDLVALSTTLATNAIVEGQGSPVCLLLIGYDRELIQTYGFEEDLATPDVVYVRGGHDGLGNEVQPLDEAAVRHAILSRRDKVEAFAVSGYFGVRNPSHELAVRAMVAELTEDSHGLPLPVTCGHELTTRLNAVRRATTVALNARLIPLLRELIATVRQTLTELGIAAPLMVVKGDGSLVRAEWAMRRPIETILSGPAASVLGAWHLAGRQDVWVVDVGGTTTDIAMLENDRPRVNPEGAHVGRWWTMVEAVDVHTVGLGGDSQVRINGAHSASNWLDIGPRRVVPLCLLASQHPSVVNELERQVALTHHDHMAAQFILTHRRATHALTESDQDLLERLATGPQSLNRLVSSTRYSFLLTRQIEGLIARRLVQLAGFTPTDALHVLGHFQRWDAQASCLGAEILAAQAGLSPAEFCQRVVEGVSNRVATELVSKVLIDEGTPPVWEQQPAAATLLTRALNNPLSSRLDCALTLKQPVIAIGAPVEAYVPRTAQQLHTELVIPENAAVANALGAVVGGVVQQVRVLIHPLDEEASQYRVHLPDGVKDFATLEESVAFAQATVPEGLKAKALQAGAAQVELKIVRTDRTAPVKGNWGTEIHLDTELTFTAVGRPSLAPVARERDPLQG
jgi:N-methylhydantoinase A/oxoprolinase/acetone carboxylase beta subunit